MTALEFWYDFHSPWAYLAATQIEALAQGHAAQVVWRPLHLAKLIATIDGRRPLEENPAFVAWYKHDLQDWAALYGVSLRYHPAFPLRPARALRAAIRVSELGNGGPFVLAIFKAYWTDNLDITDLDLLRRLATRCGLDGDEIVSASVNGLYRDKLEANTQEAITRGVFGVPSVFARGKLFFGNDRLALLDHWLGGPGPKVFSR